MSNPWTNLLGTKLSAESLSSRGLDLQWATRVDLKDCTIYNFYKDGFSIVLIDDQIDSIDFFLRNRSFTPCKLPLPGGISPEDTGSQLVEKLGEPMEKGGGNSTGIDIWLRWKGIQVELGDRSWDTAKDAPIKSITIFK
ncbi:hypothetical protein OGAPHI_004868 [Ogataea philodendri]|uniref:Uncharacterized protein n=1 Tax=Ogataea philodendri TaxID=1378263 RepID=A0A9P8P3T4_9ASCO|nr:uncharacterized protein OGAPHI_004868 [Ogataea philodendri]KAH3664154.1 hypothetical protein OGAPHI_004868 [Ogataea philodendri]